MSFCLRSVRGVASSSMRPRLLSFSPAHVCRIGWSSFVVVCKIMATGAATDARKKGYLYKLPLSASIIKVWSKRWASLYSTSHEGVVRLEYYDNEEAELKRSNKRIILLRGTTGCCENTDFKSRPYAFQFSSQFGRHVFAVDTEAELSSWIEAINGALEDDRQRIKKAKLKGALAAKKASEDLEVGDGSSKPTVTTLATLMGIYRVTLEQNELAQALNLSGIYTMDISPKGMSLVATTTETIVAKWHYKHIKSYAKSSNKSVTLEFGRGSPTGAGKLILFCSGTREMFSMIHRNIKRLRDAREKARTSAIESEIHDVQLRKKKKTEDQDGRVRYSRPSSMSYDLQQSYTTVPRQRPSQHSYDSSKRKSVPPPLTHNPSTATIGTIADDDLIKLEGFAEELDADFADLRQFLEDLPETVDDSTEPQTSKETSSGSYEVSLTHNQESFEDSFVSQDTNAVDPFVNVTDPFNVSPHGSFYNSKEDIFQNFHNTRIPYNTSTPNSSSANAHANISLQRQQPMDESLDNQKKPTGNRPSREELDQMWQEITEDLQTL